MEHTAIIPRAMEDEGFLPAHYDERARYERFKTEVIANVPDATLRPILRTAIEEHSFQWISLSLLNYGRGTAVDVSLAVPAAFEVVEGPKGVFDLEEGEALSWEMQTPKGEIEHDPTLEFNVGAGRDLDVTLYVFALTCVWGLLVAPVLAVTFWRAGRDDRELALTAGSEGELAEESVGRSPEKTGRKEEDGS